MLEEEFQRKGLRYEVVVELDSMDMVKRYVALGMGVSVGPRLAIEPEDQDELGIVSLTAFCPWSIGSGHSERQDALHPRPELHLRRQRHLLQCRVQQLSVTVTAATAWCARLHYCMDTTTGWSTAIRTSPTRRSARHGALPRCVLPIVARFRIQQHVVDPAPRLGGTQHIVAVEVSRGVDAQGGVAAPEHLVMVRYGVAILVDDEDIPLAVDALAGV